MHEQFLCTILFTNIESKYWWSKFLKKGYRHCFVMYPLSVGDRLFGDEWTVVLDPSTNYLQTQVIQNHIIDVIQTYNFNIGITEAINCQVDNICLNKYSIEVRTCVTIVKLILGKRWWWIQTPWRLRNKILESDLVKR